MVGWLQAAIPAGISLVGEVFIQPKDIRWNKILLLTRKVRFLIGGGSVCHDLLEHLGSLGQRQSLCRFCRKSTKLVA